MVTLKVSPLTRLEGHLSITAQISDGVVAEAWSHGEMFRGIEKILLGRDPRDAPIITSRICGVCHAIHRNVSLRAIENTSGFEFPGLPGKYKIPDGARIVRNLIQAFNTLYSHAAHLYVLAGPDYSDAVAGTGLTRLDPYGDGCKEAIEQQRIIHEILAVLGGKVPHQMSAIPGGISFIPDKAMMDKIREKYAPVKRWIEETAVYDLLAMFDAAKELGADAWGTGPGNFLCCGVYDLDTKTQYLSKGVYVAGERKDMDPKIITEDVTSARYTAESGGYPGETVTEYDLVKPAYTWYKAPRYDGMVVEVGPLARLVVNNLDPLSLRAEYTGDPNKSCTLNRLIARAQEILLLKDKVLEWLDELEAMLPLKDDDVYEHYKVRKRASGIGMWEAPRGATLHWISIDKEEKISQYQVIAGTTWNGCGRDADGNPGPFEQALVGVPAPPNPDLDNNPDPINILRTIRSFDPCIACSVQVITGKQRYRVQIV